MIICPIVNKSHSLISCLTKKTSVQSNYHPFSMKDSGSAL